MVQIPRKRVTEGHTRSEDLKLNGWARAKLRSPANRGKLKR